ncbi:MULTISPECIES: hypothetical protein [unclassified Leptolyngbya]|uniref:hypothetical protein n=1 Tax=unclassified Leptolyngbya TaxID=2650499 RepID=UPI001682A8F9|nr:MULTISPECIES: hypothetical protein [unclassified Leptolyngbya]MBD1913559.1 hypothetical protein [Leptolyngbya sp. FACHB-8]MBD2155870.1 hypothetical protein [Leptolyngbya sp. FACHB-16]
MLAKQLHSWLIPTTDVPTVAQRRLWFWVSMAIAIAHLIPVLYEAFSSPYIVQDDARQHVFWMWRFIDPTLFPNDLIADYFQSVAPWAYTLLYRGLMSLGLTPLLLSKLIPPVLALITTGLAYRLSLLLLPVPFVGALAALLTNQLIWSHDDLASASPRAFMLPIFLAFLQALLQRQIGWSLILMVLQGLFYPQYVFVFSGLLVLQLVQWQHGRLSWAPERRTWILSLSGLVAAFLVLLPFVLSTSEYGPVITRQEALQLPEFYPGGRSVFFNNEPFAFWINGMRSGLLPTFKPPIMGFGLLLPLLLRYPQRFPLVRRLQNLNVFVQLPAVAIALFLAAHLLLFRLHLPSRYSAYTLRFTLILAAACSLGILLDAALRALQGRQSLWRWGAITLVSLLVLAYPFYLSPVPNTNYTEGRLPKIYGFLAEQPKDSRIASLSRDADTIPTFSHRSVVVSREFTIPYHVGYSNQIRQRAIDLMEAQYSRLPIALGEVIRTYNIDYWLVDDNAFKPSALKKSWVRQYPEALQSALAQLSIGQPYLAQVADQCEVLEERDRHLLDAQCILRTIKKPY